MKNSDYFAEYLLRFEKEVMLEGYSNGLFKGTSEKILSLRPGKLDNTTEMVGFLGKKFESEKVIAFNFYGFIKFSSGLLNVVEENKKIFPNIKTIKSPVVHFQSIKIEHIQQLSKDLLIDFPEFKRFVVKLRQF